MNKISRTKTVEIRGCKKTEFFYDPMTDVVSPNLGDMKNVTFGDLVKIQAPVWQLCEGRHLNPIANMGGILPQIVIDPMNFQYSYNMIVDRLADYCGAYDDEDKDLYVVVTGITPVLVSLINVCLQYRIPLNLLHFDTSTEMYRLQRVMTLDES